MSAEADPSKQLIEALAPSEGPVAEGAFSLDVHAAGAKLSHYRLADAEQFVLLLVEVGHRLPSCTQIRFEISTHSTEVRFEGVELTGAALAELTQPDESLALASLAPRAAALELLARVVAGVRVADTFAEITLGSSRSKAVIELAAGQPPRRVRAPGQPSQTQLYLLMRERRRVWWPWSDAAEALERRRVLLLERCRHARLPLFLDGVQIGGLGPLAEGTELLEIVQDGAVVGRVGYSLARFDTTIVLVSHGVTLETQVVPEHGRYRVAEVDVSDLPRDLSMTALRHGEAYEARLAAVRAALAELEPLAETGLVGVEQHELRQTITAAAAYLALGFGIWPIAAPLVAWFGVRRGVRHARAARLRKTGEPGVAVIERLVYEPRAKRQVLEQIDMRVYLPGRAPYKTSYETHTGFMSSSALFEGARVRVYVDREDRHQLEFARAEEAQGPPQRALPPASAG